MHAYILWHWGLNRILSISQTVFLNLLWHIFVWYCCWSFTHVCNKICVFYLPIVIFIYIIKHIAYITCPVGIKSLWYIHVPVSVHYVGVKISLCPHRHENPQATHEGQDRMVTILRWHFICMFFSGNNWILIKIILNLVPKGSMNNKPALVQMITWHWTGNKPLSEITMVWFADAYMNHSALWG